MRKMVALILALMLFTCAARADGVVNDIGYPIVNEEITLSVFGCSATGQADWNEMSLFVYMRLLTGIGLDIEMVDASVFNEKLKIRFDSGNYPDIVLGGPLADVEIGNYGSQGIIIPLNELIEKYAPNIRALFEANEGLQRSVTSGDGNIYSLFYLRAAPRALQYCFWVNADWMQAAGYTKETLPSTLDELVTMLRAFKNLDYNKNGLTDEIPLEIRDIKKLRALIINAYGVVFNDKGFFAKGDGTAEYIYIGNEFRSYLEFAHKLFKEKLLDNDLFVISSAQLETNSKSNLVGLMDSPLPTTIFDITSDSDDITRYPMLGTLTQNKGDLPIKNEYDPVLKGVFSLTSACAYPEAAIRWIDYIYSYDGSMMMWQGAENSGYAYINDARTYWKALVPDGMGAEEFRRTQTPACGSEMPFAFYPEMLTGLTNKDELYSDEEASYHMGELKTAFPTVQFTLEESMELMVLEKDINNYMTEMEAKFITGRTELNDENWQKYLDAMNDLGVMRMIEIYETALGRYLSTQ